MERVLALLALFHKGSEVANPGALKDVTVIANLLVAIAVVAAAFGFKVELTQENAGAIAGGFVALLAVVNSVVHVITSKRSGLPEKP